MSSENDLVPTTAGLKLGQETNEDIKALKDDADGALDAALASLPAPPSDADLAVLLPGGDAGAAAAAAPAPPEGELPPLSAEAEAAVAQLDELHQDAYLFRALSHYDEFVAAHPDTPPAALAAALRARGIDLEQLRARAALVRRGLDECSSDDGWRLIQDDLGAAASGPGMRLMYRGGPGATAHCFKATTEMEVEMTEILSMAREFDMVPSWNSYITQAEILRVDSIVELLVYASVWLPWPFAERDVLMQAVGVDVLAEDGSMSISFASPACDGLPEGVEPPKGYEGRTHVRVLEGSCMRLIPLPPLTPGGKPRTRVVVATLLDSGAWVPEAVITFVTAVFAPFFLSAVLKVVASAFASPAQPLPARIAARPELYAKMHERVEHYLAGHPDAP